MRFLLLISLSLILSPKLFGQLIISEYLEGAGNDKCIEIYNTTGAPINLTGYNLKFYFNGSTSSGNTIDLSGTIASCGTWVVCDDGAAPSILSSADQTNTGSFFNGDDAVGLYNGTTLLDLIGTIGQDPGAEWNNVSPGTADGGFIRSLNYCAGNTDASTPGFLSFTSANWTSVGITGSNLGTHNSSCGACGTGNTITTDLLYDAPFTVDCSGPTSDNGSVDYTATGTFNPGNTYTVQLSDASGSFSNPINIGTLSSTGSGNITFTIPAGTPTGSGYLIQIVSDDPAITSTSIGPFTITQTGSCIPPALTSVIINSCNSVCGEGNNELVFGNTNDYSVLVNETNFNFSYTNSGPLDNYTDALTNNAATTQAINDLCPSTDPFIDAYGTTIPPNSAWVLANDALCPSDALDWSGLCNSGPIYIIYSTDPDWSLGGNFSNTTNDIRPYQTSITTTDGATFTIDYETDGSLYPDNDGVFATFDYNGGSATGYGDDNCTFTPVVLPVELISFDGMSVDQRNELYWSTASERNASHYDIEVSNDGFNWKIVGSIAAIGNSTETNTYQLTHHNPEKSINYYRLHQYDLDGSNLRFTKVVSIDNRMNSEELIGIYNTLGQEITGTEKGVQIYLYSDGSTRRVFKH